MASQSGPPQDPNHPQQPQQPPAEPSPAPNPPADQDLPADQDPERPGAHPHQQPGAYPPPGGGYPQRQPGGYPYQQPGYPPQQPGTYPQQLGGHPQQPGGYPQQPGGYPQQPGAYPPQQPFGYPQQAGGYPQHPGGYAQQPGAYPQHPGGYPQQPPYWSPEQPPPWTGQQQPWPPYGPGPGGPMPYGVRPAEPRAIPAPPGTPYLRLARNAKHSWWRPLAGTGLLIALAFFLTAAVLIAWEIAHGLITGELAEPQGTDIFPNDLENLAVTLVMLAILTPVVVLTAWLVQRRPPWSVASVLNRIRWRWLLWCCLPGLGYLAVSFGLSLLAGALFPDVDPTPTSSGSWVGFAAFIGPALVIVLLVPFQSAAEEFVFRGWLIQAIGAYAPDRTDGNALMRAVRSVLRTPWPALVISSALFVAAHGYTGWAMADIFLFALTMGFLTVRTGGLEAAIALHALNNLTAFLLPAATGDLEGWAEQGSAPWTLLATDLPSLAFFAVAVLWLSRRRRLPRVSE